LAKASSFAGALLLGLGAGVLVYLFGRPIAPSGSILWNVIAQLISAALLIAAGLIAEWLCVLPPEDMDKSDKEVAGEPAA
jgi:NO-binding membrane sensor protein with MHYT domain